MLQLHILVRCKLLILEDTYTAPLKIVLTYLEFEVIAVVKMSVVVFLVMVG
jgi:hypothetical protein